MDDSRGTGTPEVIMLVRTPLFVAGTAGAIMCVVGGVLAGGKGVLAAVLGTAVVLGFFAGGQLIVGRVLRSNPALALNTALLVYVLQIGVLFVLLLLLRHATFFAPKVFAFTVLVCALAWIGAAVVGFARDKPLYVVPGSGPGQQVADGQVRGSAGPSSAGPGTPATGPGAPDGGDGSDSA